MASWKPMGGVLPELNFSLNQTEMSRLTAAFKAFPGAVQQAILHATDRTRQFTRNELVRQYKGLVTLKPAYIGRGIKSRKARQVRGGAEAVVRIATSTIPLSRYKVNPGGPPQLKGVSVSARRRTNYRLRLGGRVHGDMPNAPGAAGKLFVQRMGSGHIGVYYRLKNGGLAQQYAPSLQYHAHADGFMDHISELSAARFHETFKDEAREITGVTA